MRSNSASCPSEWKVERAARPGNAKADAAPEGIGMKRLTQLGLENRRASSEGVVIIRLQRPFPHKNRKVDANLRRAGDQGEGQRGGRAREWRRGRRRTHGRRLSLAADHSGHVSLHGQIESRLGIRSVRGTKWSNAHAVNSVRGKVVEVRVEDDVVALGPVRRPAARGGGGGKG